MKIGAFLTGRTRYRPSSWGTKFILQVEEDRTDCHGFMSPMMSTTRTAKWRDARISDFNLLSIKTPEACPAQQASTTEN